MRVARRLRANFEVGFGLRRAGAIEAVDEQVMELAPHLGAPVQKERVEEAVKDDVAAAVGIGKVTAIGVAKSGIQSLLFRSFGPNIWKDLDVTAQTRHGHVFRVDKSKS